NLFLLFSHLPPPRRLLHSFPTRRSSDLHRSTAGAGTRRREPRCASPVLFDVARQPLDSREVDLLHCLARPAPGRRIGREPTTGRSEEHTSELQSLRHLVCRLLLEKKKIN